jgi:glycosyltransferase involved in cell wall biosynthesis
LNGSVSVVLAAHNEAVTIGDLVRSIRQHTPNLAEIIVVDDGSSDGTDVLARDAGATVFRLLPNRGKGVAIRHGIEKASGDVVVLLDADGQDDPAEIPLLLNALVPGTDLVIGSRFLGTFAPNSITRINRVGNRFLTEVLNLLHGTRVTDTQAGFKAVRRTALERTRLRATRFNIEVELLLQVVRTGGRVAEVGVSRSPRVHGQSRLHAVKDGTIILRTIVEQRLGL